MPGEEEAKDGEADSEPVGTLTAMERRVLRDFRAAEAAKERAEAAFADTGAGGDSRDSWDSIFAEQEDPAAVLFSPFHAHFAGEELLAQDDLLEQARRELRLVRKWDEAEAERKRESLCEALPDMSLAIREKKLSRRNLSAAKAKQAYAAILQKFIRHTVEEKRKAAAAKSAPAEKRPKKRKAKRKKVAKAKAKKSRGVKAATGVSKKSKKSRKSKASSSDGTSSDDEASAYLERLAEKNRNQQVGLEEYSKDHLFACQEYLQRYQSWFDPMDPSTRAKTIPKEMRKFIARYFAEPGAPVMTAFEQKRVQGKPGEKAHVSHLLNKAGSLGSKVAMERLARAGKALDDRGRLIEGEKLSAKARAKSIERECRLVHEIRWLCDLLSEGPGGYASGRKKLRFQSKLDNFRGANPDVPEATAKKVVKAVADTADKSTPTPKVTGPDLANAWAWSQYGGGGWQRPFAQNPWAAPPQVQVTPQRPALNKKIVCYHCGEKGHPARVCPGALAGKPPAKGSFFAKFRGRGLGRGNGRGRGRGRGRGAGIRVTFGTPTVIPPKQ